MKSCFFSFRAENFVPERLRADLSNVMLLSVSTVVRLNRENSYCLSAIGKRSHYSTTILSDDSTCFDVALSVGYRLELFIFKYSSSEAVCSFDVQQHLPVPNCVMRMLLEL